MKNFLLLVMWMYCSACGYSQSPVIIQKDPEIDLMVKEVSPDSLESYIKTLVAFGTRNTLSTQLSAAQTNYTVFLRASLPPWFIPRVPHLNATSYVRKISFTNIFPLFSPGGQVTKWLGAQ